MKGHQRGSTLREQDEAGKLDAAVAANLMGLGYGG